MSQLVIINDTEVSSKFIIVELNLNLKPYTENNSRRIKILNIRKR